MKPWAPVISNVSFFTYFLKFLQILPSSLYFKLVAKGMKKIDY